jgi:hypothetical protein
MDTATAVSQLVSEFEDLAVLSSSSSSSTKTTTTCVPSLQQFYRLGLLLYRISQNKNSSNKNNGRRRSSDNNSNDLDLLKAYQNLIETIPDETLISIFGELRHATQTLLKSTYTPPATTTTRNNNNNNNNDEYIVSWWIDIIIWMVYAFSYYVLLIGCFGRTIGMGILGLLMVSKNGNRVSILKVCGQGILNPLNKIFFGWIVGFIRRDGKMWSDLIGGVAIVYAWDSTSYMVDSKNNAEMAMSLTDFDNIIATEEKEEQEQEQEQEQEKKKVRATTSTDNSKKKNNNSSNDDDDDDDDVDDNDIELGIRR